MFNRFDGVLCYLRHVITINITCGALENLSRIRIDLALLLR